MASLLLSISKIPSIIAFFSPCLTKSEEARIPISWPIASIIIDLPDPVSPLSTVKPSEK